MNTAEPPFRDADTSSDYASVADEVDPALATSSENEEQDSDDEDDSDEGKGGKSGGKSPKSRKDYDVVLDPLFSFDMEELPFEESLLKKVGLLMVAPFSGLVPGASALASENDLSRKLFMGNLGLQSSEFSRDLLADPDMIKKLDEKQRAQMQREGIEHPDSVAAAGAAAIALAAMALTRSDESAAKAREIQQNKAQKDAVKTDLSSRVDDDKSSIKEVMPSENVYADMGHDGETLFSPDNWDDIDGFIHAGDADSSAQMSYADIVENEDVEASRPMLAGRVVDADFSLQRVFEVAAIALQASAQTVALEQQIDFTPKNQGPSR